MRYKKIGKLIDLKGKRFGKLTVLYKNSKRTPSGILQTYWHCKCDCGRECDKSSRQLRSNEYISCGICAPKKLRNDYNDLTGMRFGKLLVLGINLEKRQEEFEKGKFNIKTYWNCKCDCGNSTVVRSDSLKSGKVISCGCYNKKILKEIVPKINWKTNDIVKFDNMLLIKSSNSNDYFIIDSEDYNKIRNYCWCNSNGYAVAAIRGEKNKFIRMHRIIMNCSDAQDDLVVDHINHNTLDNRKVNLRIATDIQNNWNSIHVSNSGVKYNPNNNKWNVFINYKLQRINLGSFNTYNEALDIRNKAEYIFYGEFRYSKFN